jgi:hypothetical protein
VNARPPCRRGTKITSSTAASIAWSLRCPRLPATELTKDSLRAAFAAYAETHSAASIRRCWSTSNTLCTYLYTAELIDDNSDPATRSGTRAYAPQRT